MSMCRFPGKLDCGAHVADSKHNAPPLLLQEHSEWLSHDPKSTCNPKTACVNVRADGHSGGRQPLCRDPGGRRGV